MDLVQIALADTSYAASLRELLLRNGSFSVLVVDAADAARDGVIVVDSAHLDQRVLGPVCRPERVVLISPNDPAELARAWDAGISSVIFERDPLNTALLAILSAKLRLQHKPSSVAGLAADEDETRPARPRVH
jgi:hypothetical protein